MTAQVEPEPPHIHKWVQKKKKTYKPTKGIKTRNAHDVTKTHYICKTCSKSKIERNSPHQKDSENEKVPN